jgi:hypothetical protein
MKRAPDAPAELTLTVDNAMPDAVLEGLTSSGDSVAAVPVIRDRPTQKQWTVTLPPGSDAMIRIHPARADPDTPWRFALLSDIQEAIDRVQDIYSRMNADPSITFVVSAGDLTSQGKVEQLERFQRELEQLGVPYFATLAGGHVDLTLYGHIHSYYPFSNAGIPAYISGGGGAIPERFDGIGRHYLTIDVDPARGVLQTAVVRIDND